MPTFQQKQWPPNQTFSESYGHLLGFLKGCNQHRLLAHLAPELYTAYLLPLKSFSPASLAPPGSTGLTTFFHFRAQPDYYLDLVRTRLARLLVAAVKAHFLLAEGATVYREPVLFSVPDLSRAGEPSCGLLYPLKLSASTPTPASAPSSGSFSSPVIPGQEYAILVADWDLSLTSSQLPSALARLPVALGSNSFGWASLSSWHAQRQSLASVSSWLLASGGSRSSALKQFNARLRQLAHASVSRSPSDPLPSSASPSLTLSSLGIGEALDYDFSFKDDLKQAGAVWVPASRSSGPSGSSPLPAVSGQWHLPLGLDLASTREYLDYLHQLSPADRYHRRWWNKGKFPVAGHAKTGTTALPPSASA